MFYLRKQITCSAAESSTRSLQSPLCLYGKHEATNRSWLAQDCKKTGNGGKLFFPVPVVSKGNKICLKSCHHREAVRQ